MQPSSLKIVCLAIFLFILIYDITSHADDYYERQKQLLMDYINSNDAKGVSRLVYTGVDLNMPSRGSRWIDFLHHPTTPLIAAVLVGNRFIVDTLLEAKADPNVRDESGRLPLTLAIKQNKPEIAKKLAVKTDLGLVDEHGDTPLIWAAEHAPDPLFIKILLDAGADPNAQNSKNGDTALIKASSNDDADIIRILLKARADPYIENKNHKTSMTIAQNYIQIDNPYFIGGFPLFPDGAPLLADSHFGAMRALGGLMRDEQRQECPQVLSE